MLLLIGSQAIRHHVENYRMPADTDLVGTYDDVMEYRKAHKMVACYPISNGNSVYMRDSSGHITEAEIAWSGSRAEKLIEFVAAQEDTLHKGAFMIPSLDVLYLLKMSHRYLKDSSHFRKTMLDVQMLRDEYGCKIREEHQEFFKQREKDTYLNTLPKLNKTKGEFFSGDSIVYEWDHDSLHEALKFFNRPAYTFFSGGEVWSDMKKFKLMPMPVRLHAVLEESLVLAAERSQLAFPDAQIDPEWSFTMALTKVCTSITSGVFREFAWNNYDKVVALYHAKATDYMDRVRAGIASGVVKKLT